MVSSPWGLLDRVPLHEERRGRREGLKGRRQGEWDVTSLPLEAWGFYSSRREGLSEGRPPGAAHRWAPEAVGFREQGNVVAGPSPRRMRGGWLAVFGGGVRAGPGSGPTALRRPCGREVGGSGPGGGGAVMASCGIGTSVRQRVRRMAFAAPRVGGMAPLSRMERVRPSPFSMIMGTLHSLRSRSICWPALPSTSPALSSGQANSTTMSPR